MTRPGAKRRPAAIFGRALRRAMERRSVTCSGLARAIRANPTSVAHWYHGRRMITPQNVDRIAEALDWPQGRELVLRLRRKICADCGREFVDMWRKGKAIYCSKVCQNRAHNVRQRGGNADLSQRRMSRETLFTETLDAFCLSCEPDRLCKTPECGWQVSGLSRWPLIRKPVKVLPVLPMFVSVRRVA